MRPGSRGGEGRGGVSYANPSAVIAAELALANDARTRGLWTALAASAAPDAILFTPTIAWAQVWLKGRTSAPQPWTRAPSAVWSSCDGSLMAARGTWRKGAQSGAFVTLWARQPSGSYRWIVAENVPQPAAEPAENADMITAQLADCPDRGRDGAPKRRGGDTKAKPVKLKDLPPLDPAGRSGSAADGSLRWSVAVQPGGARRITVLWRRDGADATIVNVLASRSAGPAG